MKPKNFDEFFTINEEWKPEFYFEVSKYLGQLRSNPDPLSKHQTKTLADIFADIDKRLEKLENK